MILNPIKNPIWELFVKNHPEATIFHHPAWIELIEKQYGFKCFAFCLTLNGVISAGIPFCEIKTWKGQKKWVCLPFSDYCGPLFFKQNDLEKLLEEIKEKAKQEKVLVEIRTTLNPELGFDISYQHWLHIKKIDIEPENLFKSFKATRVQHLINKAKNSGLQTEIRQDVMSMEIFYQLHLLTRKKLGVPVQPKRYFKYFLQNLIEKNLGFISLTKLNNKYISAAVFCGFSSTLTYKYGASDPAYKNYSGNQIMLWDTMLYAQKQGFSSFDFGKTSYKNIGLREFKNGWNAIEENLAYSYFPYSPKEGIMEKINLKIIMPIIQKSPKFVCRLAGELFYKYFAV